MSEELAKEIEAFEKEYEEARQSPGVGTEEEPQQETQVVEETQPEEAPETSQEVSVEETPTEETAEDTRRYTIPKHEKFGEFAGKKLTAKEMEEAGLLEKFNTLENGEMHHQKLYENLKKEHEELLRKIAENLGNQQQQQQQQSVDPKVQTKSQLDAMRSMHMENLKQAAESGAFEEDFLVMFPDLSVQLEHRFSSGAAAIDALAKQVAEQQAFIQALVGVVQQEAGNEQLRGAVTGLVESNPDRYAPISDAEMQNRFIGWMMAEDNPIPYRNMEITPGVLSQAYLGFVDSNPDLFKGQTRQQAHDQVKRAVQASGGRGSGVHARTSNNSGNEYSEFINEVTGALRGR